MNLAQAAWEQNHVSRVEAVVGRHCYGSRARVRVVLLAAANASGVKGASRTHRADSGRGLFAGRPADRHRRVRIITAKVWDAETGKELFPLEWAHGSGSVRRVFPRRPTDRHRKLGQDGQSLGRDHREVCTSSKGIRKEIFSVAVSTDGQRIVTGSLDHTAKIWDATTGNSLEFTNHTQGVWAVAFSPDGRRVVSGSWDKTARVWDANSGKELIALAKQTNAVFSVAFSPDGQTIVTGSKDGTVQLWDAWSGAHRQTFDGHQRPVFSVSFSPDGQRIISGAMTRRHACGILPLGSRSGS